STSRTARPSSSRRRATRAMRVSTTRGARPSESSSTSNTAPGEPGEVVKDLLERDGRARRLAPVARARHQGAEVFLNGQGLEDLVPLRDQDEAPARQLVRGPAGHDRLLEDHLTPDDLGVVRAEKAGDGAERGGLARAVGPEQRDDRAGWHPQGHALDRGRDMVIDDLEILELEEGRHDAGRSGR